MSGATLILSREDVANCLHATSLIESLREAFRVGTPNGLGDKVPVVTRRVVSPTPKGPTTLLHVFEGASGTLMAVMEATRLLTLQRALIGALATDALAAKNASRVALIGASAETSLQLKSLRLVRSLELVRIFDSLPQNAALLAHRLYESLALPAREARTVEEAVGDVDIVLVEASEPVVLFPGMVAQGTHLQSLRGSGAFAPNLIAQSRSFHDAASGHEGEGTFLGAVLRGEREGRPKEGTVTLFSSFDPEWLDAVSAWDVYQAAAADEALTRFEFSTSERAQRG